jgi:hypothetical protein
MQHEAVQAAVGAVTFTTRGHARVFGERVERVLCTILGRAGVVAAGRLCARTTALSGLRGHREGETRPKCRQRLLVQSERNQRIGQEESVAVAI